MHRIIDEEDPDWFLNRLRAMQDDSEEDAYDRYCDSCYEEKRDRRLD